MIDENEAMDERDELRSQLQAAQEERDAEVQALMAVVASKSAEIERLRERVEQAKDRCGSRMRCFAAPEPTLNPAAEVEAKHPEPSTPEGTQGGNE